MPMAACSSQGVNTTESLLARIKSGDDFGGLAKKFSQDPVTRSDGGNLGCFPRGTLPPKIEDVVFAMKKDQVRGPLRGDNGFHLIQLLERQESSARPYKEVRAQLRQQLIAEKTQKATKAWLREVRKRAHTDIRL